MRDDIQATAEDPYCRPVEIRIRLSTADELRILEALVPKIDIDADVSIPTN